VSAGVTEDSVQIARLVERVASMDRDLKQQMHELKQLQEQLSMVLSRLDEAKGGWRLLMYLGGGSATLGGAVSWLVTHVTFKW